MKYLYGLSIQGIQSYIFETSKLKEVIGASELVASLPKNIVERTSGLTIKDDDENLLINAAGNFKYIFESDISCKAVFKNLPKEFAKNGGNITVSQAVIPFASDEPTKKDIDELEKALKAQRNRQNSMLGLGLMAVNRVGETGNPECREKLDYNQLLKRNALHEGKNSLLDIVMDVSGQHKFTDDIEKFTNESYGNWIAVVHADGNGLGQKIIRMAKKMTDVKGGFRELSKRLKAATEKAVKIAFEKSVLTKIGLKETIPFRPVIIGGDDVTVIMRGDLALGFTEKFLEEFEKETIAAFEGFDEKFINSMSLFKDGLTACAGIAYIKSHYPFHYGIELAEQLTKEAKKKSKSISEERAPSSLMFHKMHSSFVRKWENIEKTELKAGKVSFVNGPYFLSEQENQATIKKLQDWVEQMQRPIAPKSNIRQWLSLLEGDTFRAKELAERTKQMNTTKDLWKDLDLDTMLKIDKTEKTHLFDVLTLTKIQSTKKNQ
jgi:CRISPR/Cas system-associated protein Cas10 (large subunit of type III CRISPR-Cas system)